MTAINKNYKTASTKKPTYFKINPRHFHLWSKTTTTTATTTKATVLTRMGSTPQYRPRTSGQGLSLPSPLGSRLLLHPVPTTMTTSSATTKLLPSKGNFKISTNQSKIIEHQPTVVAYYRSCLLVLMSLTLAISNAVAAPMNTTTTTTTTSTIVSLNSTTSISLNSTNEANTTRSNPLHSMLPHQSPALNSRLRKRHSKRHSIGYDPYDLNENSTILEWVNPCGGFYDSTAEPNQKAKRKHPRKIYNGLKVTAGREFRSLKDDQQYIDIDNFEMWSMHRRTYKFLPKLKTNSSIALKRWYRNMQTYVASFAYLRRIQLKWDHSKAQSESDIANELNTLLISSRSILCELETAVNKTHPYQRRQLPQVSRQQMNKRLKLRTRESAIHHPGVMQEANSIDLKFVKYYYYEFLENMWKVLRKFTKRNGQIALNLNKNPKEVKETEKVRSNKKRQNKNTKKT